MMVSVTFTVTVSIVLTMQIVHATYTALSIKITKNDRSVHIIVITYQLKVP
jgi:hypothetical protein